MHVLSEDPVQYFLYHVPPICASTLVISSSSCPVTVIVILFPIPTGFGDALIETVGRWLPVQAYLKVVSVHIHFVVETLYVPSQSTFQQFVSESVSLVHDVEMQEPPEHVFPVAHVLPLQLESAQSISPSQSLSLLSLQVDSLKQEVSEAKLQELYPVGVVRVPPQPLLLSQLLK